MFDEADKFFERIITVRFLSRIGPNLKECQYGFRESRSTIDAVKNVKALLEDITSRGRSVMLAVSLDITNAFNTLPWEC